MDVRCELTLREKSGKTLMGDYKRVYKFLIDVIRAGYRMVKKFITRDEAHIALRTVWGRSRQYKTATDKKKQSHENGELKSKRSGRRSGRHSRRPHWEYNFFICEMRERRHIKLKQISATFILRIFVRNYPFFLYICPLTVFNIHLKNLIFFE